MFLTELIQLKDILRHPAVTLVNAEDVVLVSVFRCMSFKTLAASVL